MSDNNFIKSLPIGSLFWAKIKGYPNWPCIKYNENFGYFLGDGLNCCDFTLSGVFLYKWDSKDVKQIKKKLTKNLKKKFNIGMLISKYFENNYYNNYENNDNDEVVDINNNNNDNNCFVTVKDYENFFKFFNLFYIFRIPFI